MLFSFNKNTKIIALSLILLLATCFRLPFVYEGSPYLYREDEAHHFNRILNMLKSGNLDPDYFHKPSLHFYLRLPVASAAFLYSVKKSEIKEVKEIITSDPFGLADYAFSASHPRILHISRGFSLFLSLSAILLTFLICQQLSFNTFASLSAALLLAISPSATAESAVIGVDGPMTFFALFSVYLGIRACKLKTTLSLFWCAAACGLTLSCKYNALPILILPIAVLVYNKNFSFERCLTALFVSPIFFLLGSPYLIFSLPKFLNQFGYEIWHYGVAGHVGHKTNPGFDQLKFYLSWLATDAIGLIALLLGIVAAVKFFRFELMQRKLTLSFIAAIFPACFFILMLSQKTNFERNMLVIIPFACMLCAAALNIQKNNLLIRAVFLICLLQPLISCLKLSYKTANIPESRLILLSELSQLSESQKPVAVDGELQVVRSILELTKVDRVNFESNSSRQLFQQGYKTLVLSSAFAEQLKLEPYYRLDHSVAGSDHSGIIQRIVSNPNITIFKANNDLSLAQLLDTSVQIEIDAQAPDYGSEGLIWLQNTVSELKLNNISGAKKLNIVLFSPWPEQNLKIHSDAYQTELNFNAATEANFTITLKPGSNSQKIAIISQQVISPASAGISSDNRKLAFAIKKISVE